MEKMWPSKYLEIKSEARWQDWAFIALVLSLVCLLILPLSPTMPVAGLDPSWQQTLHYAYLHNWQFGTDIIFTMGPFGFLYSDIFNPSTFPTQLAVYLVLGSTLGWALAETLLPLPVLHRLLFLVPIIAAMSYGGKDTALFLLPLLLGLRSVGSDGHGRGTDWLSAALAIMCALASLTKFSAAMLSVILIVLSDLYRLILLRRPPILSLIFAIALISLFVAAGQKPTLLPAFVLSSISIAAGYSESMQLFDSAGMSIVFAALSAAALLILFVDSWRQRSIEGAVVGLLVALTIFMIFKAGFVRDDSGHLTIAANGLCAVIALVAAKSAAVRTHTTLRRRGLNLLCILSFAWAISGSLVAHDGGYMAAMRAASSNTVKRIAAVGDLFSGRLVEQFSKDYEHSLSLIRKSSPLPPLIGSVDIFSWDQAAALAMGFDLKSRPIFQSYSAYTPDLIQKNLEFLRAPDAPATILFNVQTIDARFPTLDDGALWPELISRYDVATILPHFVELRRRAAARGYRLIPLLEQNANWDTPIVLPQTGGLIWAELDIEKTLAGSLMTTLLKAPPVKLTVTTAAGATKEYRLPPLMAHTGFLISPLVETKEDFARLYSADPRLERERIVRIQLHVKGGPVLARAYRSDFSIRLYSLEFAHPASTQ